MGFQYISIYEILIYFNICIVITSYYLFPYFNVSPLVMLSEFPYQGVTKYGNTLPVLEAGHLELLGVEQKGCGAASCGQYYLHLLFEF